MMISVFDKVGDNVRKGEISGYQHLYSFLNFVKTQDCVV